MNPFPSLPSITRLAAAPWKSSPLTDFVSRPFSTRPAAAPWKSSPRVGLVSPQEPGGLYR